MSDSSPQASQSPQDLQLRQLSRGFMLSQVILTAAELEIDRLWRTAQRRLMNWHGQLPHNHGTSTRDAHIDCQWDLCGVGGRPFRKRSPVALPMAFLCVMSGSEGYRVWGDLLSSLKTGEPGFPRVFGKTFFEYLAGNPRADKLWNRWNAETASEWLTR